MAKKLYLQGVMLDDAEISRRSLGDNEVVERAAKVLVPAVSSASGSDPSTGSVPGLSQANVAFPGTYDPITDTVIEPGGDPVTLWQLAVAASSNVTVQATLSASTDDGDTGGHLDGVLVCTAKRYKSGALAITSQSAALPWVLSDPSWLPQFVASGNNLLLQLTPDSEFTVQVRDSGVRYSAKDTSADVAPAAHDQTWFFGQVTALLGSKVIEQFATPTGSPVITGINGVNGHVMANAGAGNYTAGIIGTQGRPATTAPAAFGGCLRCADVGQPIKSVVSVCSVPTFPDATNYQVLMGTGLISNPTGKTMVESGGTALFVNDWSHYVNNVSTHALPAAGSIVTIRADLAANTDQSFQCGYTTADFVWRGAVGYWLLLNAAMSAEEAAAFETLAHGYFD